jgi:hypothetical protein
LLDFTTLINEKKRKMKNILIILALCNCYQHANAQIMDKPQTAMPAPATPRPTEYKATPAAGQYVYTIGTKPPALANSGAVQPVDGAKPMPGAVAPSSDPVKTMSAPAPAPISSPDAKPTSGSIQPVDGERPKLGIVAPSEPVKTMNAPAPQPSTDVKQTSGSVQPTPGIAPGTEPVKTMNLPALSAPTDVKATSNVAGPTPTDVKTMNAAPTPDATMTKLVDPAASSGNTAGTGSAQVMPAVVEPVKTVEPRPISADNTVQATSNDAVRPAAPPTDQVIMKATVVEQTNSAIGAAVMPKPVESAPTVDKTQVGTFGSATSPDKVQTQEIAKPAVVEPVKLIAVDNVVLPKQVEQPVIKPILDIVTATGDATKDRPSDANIQTMTVKQPGDAVAPQPDAASGVVEHKNPRVASIRKGGAPFAGNGTPPPGAVLRRRTPKPA